MLPPRTPGWLPQTQLGWWAVEELRRDGGDRRAGGAARNAPEVRRRTRPCRRRRRSANRSPGREDHQAWSMETGRRARTCCRCRIARRCRIPGRPRRREGRPKRTPPRCVLPPGRRDQAPGCGAAPLPSRSPHRNPGSARASTRSFSPLAKPMPRRLGAIARRTRACWSRRLRSIGRSSPSRGTAPASTSTSGPRARTRPRSLGRPTPLPSDEPKGGQSRPASRNRRCPTRCRGPRRCLRPPRRACRMRCMSSRTGQAERARVRSRSATQ